MGDDPFPAGQNAHSFQREQALAIFLQLTDDPGMDGQIGRLHFRALLAKFGKKTINLPLFYIGQTDSSIGTCPVLPIRAESYGTIK
jgi:hypothetical protein